ncbi:MAG TPA: ThiF family adenylyltransferase [Woeseiaceae bacterium]|nr:ThiF family adenylyltransferase [Woeseiaceae bacterium]
MKTDFSRYNRQMLLPGFGNDGQQRLRDSTALLLGCGALGSAAAEMLARAGVGHLVIVDRDFVELTNLQRQTLFDEQDVKDALPKAIAAKKRLEEINSDVHVTAIVDDINHTNIERYATGVDILVDGLDNFETRYLANDVAVKHSLPYVYGGAVGTTGMAIAFMPHTDTNAPWTTSPDGDFSTPCFRCLFEEAPPPGSSPTCDTVGVIGPLVAIIANIEVTEALKILTGNYDRVRRKLLNIDVWANDFYELEIDNAYTNGDCPCCKQHRFDFLSGSSGSSAVSLCGRNAVQIRHRQENGRFNLDGVAARLQKHGVVSANEYMLRSQIADSNKLYELTLFPDGRAIIKGTDDPQIARSLYSKYVGT